MAPPMRRRNLVEGNNLQSANTADAPRLDSQRGKQHREYHKCAMDLLRTPPWPRRPANNRTAGPARSPARIGSKAMFYGIGGAKRFQFSPKSPRASDGSIDAEPSLSAYLTMTDCQPYPGLHSRRGVSTLFVA